MPDQALDAAAQESPELQFARLLRTHLERGTRPSGLSRPWTRKEFAEATSASESSVSRWLAGRIIPSHAMMVTGPLFGDSPEHQQLRDELTEVHKRARKQKYQRDDPASSIRNLINSSQSYATMTAIDETHWLISFSLNVKHLHNYIEPISSLTSRHSDDFDFSISNNIDDFFTFLLSDYSINSLEVTKSNVYNLINTEFSIIYRGSLQAATTKDIGKLPTLIKAMASLSPRQFRVGLLRLGTSIVVISVAGGVGGYVGWELVQKMHDVASYAAAQLTQKEHGRKPEE